MEASTTPPAPSAGTKKEKNKMIHRRIAPSKAPARVLKKQIRSLERLLANTTSDSARALPEAKLAETKAKILALQKQLQDLPPPGTNTGPSATMDSSKKKDLTKKRKADGSSGHEDGPSVRGTKGLKARELRRAGRKIVAFKKQHPDYESNESEAKSMADLELDLLYIKHFPRNEPYISIYPDEPHEDDKQIALAEIRQKIADAVEKGEIRHGKKPQTMEGAADTLEHDPENPISNWSDDSDDSAEEDDDDDEEEEEEPQERNHKNKRTKTK